MNVRQAYNIWADQYDTNNNKTRDTEAIALKESLINIDFETCLEIGCGTGKNTEWLATQANTIVAVDFSEEMLAKARKKIASDKVIFQQADINNNWTFASIPFDLISFSLVLEHIEDLNHIFRQASNFLVAGGYVYIGELHPFKQYTGSKARFDTEEGQQILPCFNHNISDFTLAAKKFGFEIADIKEYFDGNNRLTIPRIIAMLFRKP